MLAVKLGVATRYNLAEQCRKTYPTFPRIVLWIMAEIAIIGSDMQEVIGSAIALYLLSQKHLPLWGGVLITTVDTFLVLLIERFGIRKLEAIFQLAVLTMCSMFGTLAFKAGIPAGPAIKGFFVPSLPASTREVAMGMVGALIMPHNIFLHSALVRNRTLDLPDRMYKRSSILYFGLEGAMTLCCTVFINCCVVAVFGRGFYRGDRPDNEAPDIGLTSASDQLRGTFGDAAPYLFAFGLLAAGQSSTITGTYTGQFVMSGFLNLKISPFKRILVTRLVAICPTILIAVIFRGETALDHFNSKLNLLQAVQLPFALLPLVYITSRREVMGDFVNKRATLGFALLIAAACISLNMTVTVGIVLDVFGHHWALMLLGFTLLTAYVSFMVYLAVGPSRWARLYAWGRQQLKGKSAGGAASPRGASVAEAVAEGVSRVSKGKGSTSRGSEEGHQEKRVTWSSFAIHQLLPY